MIQIYQQYCSRWKDYQEWNIIIVKWKKNRKIEWKNKKWEKPYRNLPSWEIKISLEISNDFYSLKTNSNMFSPMIMCGVMIYFFHPPAAPYVPWAPEDQTRRRYSVRKMTRRSVSWKQMKITCGANPKASLFLIFEKE